MVPKSWASSWLMLWSVNGSIRPWDATWIERPTRHQLGWYQMDPSAGIPLVVNSP